MMMDEEHQLVEIPPYEWSTLQKLYENKKHEPVSWNLLQNYIDWRAKDSTIDDFKIFSLNGDWSDGTFVIQDKNMLFFNTLNDNQDRLLQALQCTDKIESQSAADYNSFDFARRVKPTVDTFMAPTGIPVDVTAIWYYMPREEALNFDINPPDGVTVASLTQANVESVDCLWAYRSESSQAFISRLVRLNLNVGAFSDDGELLAWCFQMPMGCIGLLHVKEDQRRKGLAGLVVRALSKKMAENLIEVTISAVEGNIASMSLFEKLGFEKIDCVHWARRPNVNKKN